MALTHDVVLVTKDSHPALFKAFELISHDNGRQAGHVNYAIPMDYYVDPPELGVHLDRLNWQLQMLLDLADVDFEALCIGDEDARQRIVKERGLEDVDLLLQRFFEEFA